MGRKSILNTEKGRCYRCQKVIDTELHHIYYGKNRKASDKMGFTVYLCPECHRGTYGVHGKYGHEVDMDLKRICQWTFEQKRSREEFLKHIGRSYI